MDFIVYSERREVKNMPPQAKFSRKEIVSTALEITRENGLGAVTARELGTRLKSSARPIFTVFENMEEVNKEVVKAAREVLLCQNH